MQILKKFQLARGILLAVMSLTFGLAPAPTKAAQAQSHNFKLYIKGITAGTISTSAQKNGTGYTLSGAVKPSAFLRLLRDVGYVGKSSGSYTGNSYSPQNYTGYTKTGSRTSTVKMRFAKGKPIVDAYLPSRAKRDYDIDPGAQKGTIDLLTAVHSVFEDSAAKDLCNRIVTMFDGRRRSELTLLKPKKSGTRATCSGKYTRIAGFSPRNMQKRVNFPFSLVYEQQNDGNYRLMSFHTQTTFGDAKAVRK